MEITGFFTALLIGTVIGALGRLALPGRQKIRLWLTVLIGIFAALLGTFLAGLLGVDETPRIDWIELALQIGAAAGGIALYTAARSGRDRDKRRR